MKRHKRNLATAVIALGVLTGVNAEAARWTYKQGADELSDERYFFAAGFAFDYKFNNDFTVAFQCKGGKVRFEIDVDTLINSKGKPFPFAYRVDKRDPRQLSLKTYSNQGEGGYTYDNVQGIAKDILGGNEMFVRAVTWNNDYLEARISLAGADANIKKVFADCGVGLDSSVPKVKPPFSLADFTAQFKKLTSAQQQEVLRELHHILKKY